MKKTRIREEVLKMRLEDIYDRYQKSQIATQEASVLLDIMLINLLGEIVRFILFQDNKA